MHPLQPCLKERTRAPGLLCCNKTKPFVEGDRDVRLTYPAPSLSAPFLDAVRLTSQQTVAERARSFVCTRRSNGERAELDAKAPVRVERQ